MESYDLFLSVGPACRPARHLLYNNLRQFASPLDWQMLYSLDTVIELFRTSFSTFFCNISEDVSKNWGKRWVIDKTNHIVSVHYFDKDIPLEDCQKQFIPQMHRRYVNLHNKLKACNTLMLVCNRQEDIKTFEKFLFEFSELYENLHITLMNIRDEYRMNSTDVYTKKYNISDKLTIIEHVFNDSIDSKTGEKYSWRGNETLWNSVLQDYCLLDVKNTLDELYDKLKGKNIVVYGAGLMCFELINELRKYNIKVSGIVPYEETRHFEHGNLPMSVIENYSHDDVILIAKKYKSTSLAIKNILLSKGYDKLVEFDFTHGIFPNVEDIQKL